MDRSNDWKRYWDQRSLEADSDFAFDRGVSPRGADIEALAERELLDFIEPKPSEVVFDAGCGTGANVLLLHDKVQEIIGIDYSRGAVERCRVRISEKHIENAKVDEGSITRLPAPDRSVDKVICMSVLQYVDDSEVKVAFQEFARILRPGGTAVLHVKNLSSLYLATLWVIKHLKSILGRPHKLGYYRTYAWYARTLVSAGFQIVDYNSFELLTLPKMPTWLVVYLQKLELRNYRNPLLRSPWVRRHGAELKIKATLRKSANG